MRLVAQGRAEAFEMLYERHGTAAFSLAYRMVREPLDGRGHRRRRPSSRCGAAARATTGRAAASGPGCSGSCTTARSTRCVAPSSTIAAGRATRGSRSASRRHERTEVEAARRDEARSSARASTACPPSSCKAIELAYFGGFTHSRDRRHARDAGRHGEGAHAPRPGEDARGSSLPRGRRRDRPRAARDPRRLRRLARPPTFCARCPTTSSRPSRPTSRPASTAATISRASGWPPTPCPRRRSPSRLPPSSRTAS